MPSFSPSSHRSMFSYDRNAKSSHQSSSGGYQALQDPPSPAGSTTPILPPQQSNNNNNNADMSYYSSAPPSPSPGSGAATPNYRTPTANAYGTPSQESDHSYSDVLPSQGHSQDALYNRQQAGPGAAGGKNEAAYGTPQWWSHGPEDDDALHDPNVNTGPTGIAALCTLRGLENLGCLALFVLVLVTLFAGYPIISELTSKQQTTAGAFNLGGVNASGQIPNLLTFNLIDADTPTDAYYHTSFETGDKWELVFSDEFNRDGRSFYEGDDPYWSAVDLHYWGTKNLEWYDPEAVSTRDGSLVVRFTEVGDPTQNHNMDYMGGMISTWNRFCFSGGYIEASVSLPGTNNVQGLWPAIWTMGNLGRAGYGGSLDGLWPYSYDSCDVGTLPNQTLNGLPKMTKAQGDKWNLYDFSYLVGQRLSSCTCPDDKHHPGPKRANGSFVGRASPEIDMFEATVGWNDVTQDFYGEVSLSGQWAPFDPSYEYYNSSTSTQLYDTDKAFYNSYFGGVLQQATSVLGETDAKAYTNSSGLFAAYGFEYAPGDDGYITWLSDNKKTWTIRAEAMKPNAVTQIGQRLVSQEPMYIIINLGMSPGFGTIDYEGLKKLYPVEMWVDYIRVYQDPNKRNIGCDPDDFPTADYIASILPAYQNPNITTFDQLKAEVDGLELPKNRLVDTC